MRSALAMDKARALDGVGVGVGVGVGETHVAVLVIAPAEHDVRPFTTYPELHWGAHDIPLASAEVQLPTPAPFVGTLDASHGFASHVAGVSEPMEQEDAPETVYPVLHTG